MTCLMLLCACDGAGEVDDVVSSGKEISFSSNMAEQGQGLTRATGLGRDFTVYGYKYVNTDESAIFPAWMVEYDGGNSYKYIGVGGQTVRYWDTSATEYRFWASTGSGWVSSNSQGDWGKTLTLNNRTMRFGKTGSPATDLSDDVDLYASLVRRTAPIDQSMVTLMFNHTYSQVSVYFYYEVMQTGVAEIQIKNVKFAPVVTDGKAGVVFNKGNIRVQYPAGYSDKNAEIVTVIGDNNESRPCLDFVVNTALKGDAGHSASHAIQAEIPNHDTGLVLPDMPGEDLTRATSPQLNKFYYPLPMGEQNPDFELTMYITELDAAGNELQTVKRSAVIPATYMRWKPNYAYRYFFKITESSLALQYDVKIDPWKYGGSKDEEWTNW